MRNRWRGATVEGTRREGIETKRGRGRGDRGRGRERERLSASDWRDSRRRREGRPSAAVSEFRRFRRNFGKPPASFGQCHEKEGDRIGGGQGAREGPKEREWGGVPSHPGASWEPDGGRMKEEVMMMVLLRG